MLGHEPPAPPPEIAWTTASPSVHELLVGVYENETTFEIAVRDGTLVLESGSSVEEVLQGEDNHFRAPIQSVPDYPVWPLRFSVEASSDGKADRLRVGGRVWARRSDE